MSHEYSHEPDKVDWNTCQEVLGHRFKEKALLIEAFSHSSSKEKTHTSYERLEFLGDCIIRFFVGEQLFKHHPTYDEGQLTKTISYLVSEAALARLTQNLNLQRFLICSPSMQGQLSNSILCDIFESVTAAIYLDSGLETVHQFLERNFSILLDAQLPQKQNHKAILLEWAQKKKIELPIYEVIKAYGPAHELTFVMKIFFNGKKYGPLAGTTKKQVEQLLAKLVIETLDL